jgi:serine/threonine protein kinase
MTTGRWRAIERPYHATLERAPVERDSFLSAACEGDDQLRAEVESLLAHSLNAPLLLDSQPSRELRAALNRRMEEQSAIPGRYAGRRFGPYTLEALVASGGTGEIYRAADIRLNRMVAVKILRQDFRAGSDRHELSREARIVSSLNHPHICTVHDIGTEDNIDYIVMEYLEGETLQQRLRRGAVPLDRAIEYLIQIVDALDKSHRRGIVHRDITPANVMLTTTGVKVLDFGIATHAEGRHPGPPMATPGYGSPEQLAGHQVDARTDVLSFGTVAYEMISGCRAFQGDTPAALAASVQQDEPQPLRNLVSDLPEPWREPWQGAWQRNRTSGGRQQTTFCSNCAPPRLHRLVRSPRRHAGTVTPGPSARSGLRRSSPRCFSTPGANPIPPRSPRRLHWISVLTCGPNPGRHMARISMCRSQSHQTGRAWPTSPSGRTT